MNELFQRPANYWLRHADRHKQSGDLIRAAVLQRHAVRAEPGSDAARMQYALTLRQLHGYEASNREAFSALAAHPDQTELYGLIGCNMIALGLRREGLDALGIYLNTTAAASAPWHDEACDLAEAFDDPFMEKKRQARLNRLLDIAARRMARGDPDNAARALKRAQQTPYQGRNAKRDLLLSVYWMHRGEPERCLLHLQHALERKLFDVPVLVSAAAVSRRLHAEGGARMLLMRAAALARKPSDEQLVCHAAADMGMVFVAYAMLKRALIRKTDRCPLLYDMCVCALKMGRIQEAARHIHLCREIDPDDVPSEWLFAQVMAWQQQGLSAKELRAAARGVSFYGSCTEAELSACVQPFQAAVEQDPQALAEAIRQDGRLRRRLLFLLTLPLEWPAQLLHLVCTHLPQAECETLLREVLMQHPSDSAAKKYAMAALHRMGVSEPCACWSHGRFLSVDPQRFCAPVPTFRQRYLTRQIRRAAADCGPECVPWALEMVSRMSRPQQLRLVGDHWKVWPLALSMRWRALQGLPPARVSIQTMPELRLEALKKALRLLRRLEHAK